MSKVLSFNNTKPPRVRIKWKDPASFLEERPIPKERYPTGLPTLDAAFGGGLWPNLLLVIQGAPNAGKSSLGVQIVASYMKATGDRGRAYLYLPDEGARAGCVRMGQAAGIARDDLENTAEDAISELRRAYPRSDTPPHRVNLVDDDADEALLETFLDQITEEHGLDRLTDPSCPPPLLYVDAVQSIRTDEDSFDAKRGQIGWAMKELRTFASSLPCIVILVSHVNRPSFAAKKAEDRIDPMAGSAESADITRHALALVHLEGELADGVKALLRKNRLHRGDRPRFDLRYDIPKGAFVEVDPVILDEAGRAELDAKAAKRAADLKAAQEKLVAGLATDIERRLKKLPAGERLSGRQLLSIVGGKFANVQAALHGLEAQGVVDWNAGARGAVLWGWKG